MTDTINTSAVDGYRQRLEKFLSDAELPTIPVVARKLIDLCRDDDISFKELAQLIEIDPGLAARLLKSANSAYYGMRHPITSVERALSVLGLKYVKSIALGFHLTTSLENRGSQRFNLEDFWRQSVFRAVLARHLAQQYCPSVHNEAFLIGLLQDSGITLLTEVLPDHYALMWSKNHNSPTSLYRLERQYFDVDHLVVADMLVRKWALPDILAQPIALHHYQGQPQPTDDLAQQLCQIAYFVGTLSLNNPDTVSLNDLTLSQYAQTVFQLDHDALSCLLENTRADFNNVAQLFSNIIPHKLDATELLVQARDLLSGLAGENPREFFDLQKEIESLRRQCEQLSQSVDQYRRLAEQDDLTGMLQRDAFERYLSQALKRTRHNLGDMSVLFIDLDDFKLINDTCGHDTGDRCLAHLADLMREHFSDCGYICRYGGDEFIILVTEADFQELMHRLDRLRRGISIFNTEQGLYQNVNLSCSIGVVYCESGTPLLSPRELVHLADQQMYHIKKNGKNNIGIAVIPRKQTITPLAHQIA